ncbi:hypothetical protein AB0D34_07785 [Streptomyces sp. NPDC048420]|uniref:hypothetical protein n=1 Tax=Streptomyces sp. NPDC048420 TaxID=3155755 RepID=UPI003426C607
MDREARQAAWEVYVALHSLAAAHLLGSLPTEVQDDRVMLGDHDHTLQQLTKHEAAMHRTDPRLFHGIWEAVARWDSRPATRLVELLPLLDRLEEITGASLPPLLPPTT